MNAIQVTYLTKTRYSVDLGPHCLITDQSDAAGGDGLGPTPVQLFVASLVACAAHYAGSYLARHHLSADGLTVNGDYVMAADRPPRVASMSVTITPPTDLPRNRIAGLLAVAAHCTVHNTLTRPPVVHFGVAEQSALNGEALPLGLRR
jgi:uncharacterized OsmC-like protein